MACPYETPPSVRQFLRYDKLTLPASFPFTSHRSSDFSLRLTRNQVEKLSTEGLLARCRDPQEVLP